MFGWHTQACIRAVMMTDIMPIDLGSLQCDEMRTCQLLPLGMRTSQPGLAGHLRSQARLARLHPHKSSSARLGSHTASLLVRAHQVGSVLEGTGHMRRSMRVEPAPPARLQAAVYFREGLAQG